MTHFLKTKLFKVLELFMAALTPIVPALIFLGFFVFCDLLTGIWKAKKKGEEMKSKKLGNTVTKIVMYFILVICARIMDVCFLKATWLPFTITQAAIGFVSITEFKSIMENVSEVLGMDVWKFIRNKIDVLRNAK